MSMPTIFVSHISEEAELASLLKQEIVARFLGLVDVFQSSDPGSLPVGQNWLDNITSALRNCQAILLLCSPYSVKRPWIHFECGAGWARNIEVVPLCHTGLRPVDLPLPISLLQGMAASDPIKIGQIFGMVASKLQSTVPRADYVTLTNAIKKFEHKYKLETEVEIHAHSLLSISDDLTKIFKQIPPGQVVTISEFPERLVERARSPGLFNAVRHPG